MNYGAAKPNRESGESICNNFAKKMAETERKRGKFMQKKENLRRNTEKHAGVKEVLKS